MGRCRYFILLLLNSALLVALAVCIPVQKPSPTILPPWTPRIFTPTPLPDADLSLVFNTSDGLAFAGEELTIEYTITNESPRPASDVTVVFEVSGPSRLVVARKPGGTCGGKTCGFGSFDDYQSVTGHIVVLAKGGLYTEVTVEAELSWFPTESRRSNRKYSWAEENVPFADNNEPGAMIWATPTRGTSMGCADSVEVGPKAVYAEFGHQLYAVSKSDGEVLWLHESDLPMFQPVLADGNIYYDSREEKPRRYHIRSLDASNGMLNWERMVTGPVTGSAEVYDGSVYYIVRGPVIDGHWEYTALLSLDASTGNPNWEHQVDKSITTSAVASGGNIYFGTGVTGGGYLYYIDAKSGELNRRYETEGRPYGTPLIAGGNAYIVSWSRSIYAMDLSTGEKDWEYQPGGNVYDSPVLSDGNLYFQVHDEGAGDYQSVHALDAATGSLKWQYKAFKALLGPTVSSGSVYITTRFNLVSLDASTGSPNWQADYGITCGLLVADNGVLYGRGSPTYGFMTFAIRAR